MTNSAQGDKNQPSIDYELSSDLKNKEIEMIYRKYGGHLRCKRAARVIQLAYREYRLRKNYFKLCESNLKRRSFDMSESVSVVNGREFENRYAKVNRPILRRYVETIDQDCSGSQFTIDLPSVDFEQLVEEYNKNGKSVNTYGLGISCVLVWVCCVFRVLGLGSWQIRLIGELISKLWELI